MSSSASASGFKPGWTWLAFASFLAYFSMLFVPEIWPAAEMPAAYDGYLLTVFLLLLCLLFIGLWGVGGVLTGNSDFYGMIRLAAAGFAAALICWVVSVLVSDGLPDGSKQLEFDAKLWSSSGAVYGLDGGPTDRQRMLHDLVRNVLPGRTNGQIEELLGTGGRNGHIESRSHNLIYFTGPQRESFSNANSEWLLLWLDESGEFSRYEIVTD